MPEPCWLGLRNVMKNMSMFYELEGKMIWLYMMVQLRQTTFYTYMRYDKRSSHPGSKRFQAFIGYMSLDYVYKLPRKQPVPPEAVWLFLEMMHLVMLLAKRTKANMDVVKIWFHEAKDFLMGMEKEV